MRSASFAVRCRLLGRACKPVLSYRRSRWPPQLVLARELDSTQSKMMASILRVQRRSGEGAADYCRRRNREAAGKCREIGRWSHHWFARAKAWDAHLARGHCQASWPVLLRPFHDERWLDAHMCLTNLPGTGNRALRGRPAIRWHEGIAYVRNVCAR